ncbi:unnamed protein product [Larinioides sclopetarius]|uniref:Uncharacterized protein n=1 Tax=Larinioides sclopetarius TaxID=280406 RepID=A0AAV2C206_9ARAC
MLVYKVVIPCQETKILTELVEMNSNSGLKRNYSWSVLCEEALKKNAKLFRFGSECMFPEGSTVSKPIQEELDGGCWSVYWSFR